MNLHTFAVCCSCRPPAGGLQALDVTWNTLVGRKFCSHVGVDEFSAVFFLGVAELQRAGLESGDTEQIIQHLHRELLEAQEMANTGKQRCLELQGNSSTNDPVSGKIIVAAVA